VAFALHCCLSQKVQHRLTVFPDPHDILLEIRLQKRIPLPRLLLDLSFVDTSPLHIRRNPQIFWNWSLCQWSNTRIQVRF
jgi:hypothetical protein